MNKFQFFLVIESVLLVLGLLTILTNDFSSFIFLLVLLLLAIRFYNQDTRHNFLLTLSLLLLFLVFMLNPYIISAIVLGVVYLVVNHFAQVKKSNRLALLRFKEADIEARPIRHKWFGGVAYESDFYAFEDINVIRLSGRDTIDLSQVIVTGMDNMIVIQKVYGPTQILVPIDVTVQLDVSSVYGSVQFLDQGSFDLRNESLKLNQHQVDAVKKVKIIVNTVSGDVEVVRV